MIYWSNGTNFHMKLKIRYIPTFILFTLFMMIVHNIMHNAVPKYIFYLNFLSVNI